MPASTTGRTSLLLCRALVLALFFLSSRTPFIASTTAFGGSKNPKPSKRGLPGATARVVVSQATEKEGDAPRLPSAGPLPIPRPEGAPACPPAPGLRSGTTAPEYLKPYTPSRTDTFLWPPPPGDAAFL